jgi:type IV fimbrial biogenesis protein FimT
MRAIPQAIFPGRLQHQRGFNMIELLTAMVVAAIVLSVGIPSFTSMTQNNRMTTQSNALLATLNVARAEALKTNTQVTICKSSDNAACNNGLSWNDGWIVFEDTDLNGARAVGETLLWARANLEGPNTLVSVSFDNFIAFQPNGMSIGSTANAGFFRLCDARGVDRARDITVTRTGSSTVIDAAGGGC